MFLLMNSIDHHCHICCHEKWQCVCVWNGMVWYDQSWRHHCHPRQRPFVYTDLSAARMLTLFVSLNFCSPPNLVFFIMFVCLFVCSIHFKIYAHFYVHNYIYHNYNIHHSFVFHLCLSRSKLRSIPIGSRVRLW